MCSHPVRVWSYTLNSTVNAAVQCEYVNWVSRASPPSWHGSIYDQPFQARSEREFEGVRSSKIIGW